jgi:hypothetical protein
MPHLSKYLGREQKIGMRCPHLADGKTGNSRYTYKDGKYTRFNGSESLKKPQDE